MSISPTQSWQKYIKNIKNTTMTDFFTANGTKDEGEEEEEQSCVHDELISDSIDIAYL